MRRIATPLCVLCAALVALIVPATAGAVFGHSFDIGTSGSGLFNHPQSVATSLGSGDVYVADTANARIQRFDAGGTFQNSFPTLGPGFSPQDVAVDPTSGNVYVASPTRIDGFTSAGLPIVLASWTPAGNAYGITVDGAGDVYVSSVLSGSGQIHKYGPLGQDKGTLSGADSGPGHSLQPKGMTTGPSNTIYVADPGNNRIEKFSTGGAFLGQLNMPTYTVNVGGTSFPGVVTPQDVAVDGSGRVFVPDTGTHSNLVEVLDSSGTVQQTFGSPDSDPVNACQLRGPWGVSTSMSGSPSFGSLYVVSTGENRVRVFNESVGACPTPDFGPGGGLSGPGVSAGTPAAAPTPPVDRKKPKIKLKGFPRGLCARHNFQFRVRVRDDVLIRRITLFVNRRKVASDEIGLPKFLFKVNMPVKKTARLIPRGLAGQVLIGVRAVDSSGKKAKAKRDFLICGTK